MNPALAALAVAVVAGGVVAVSAHDGRATLLGLLVALVLSPVIAAPLPPPLALLSRWASAALVAYLMWIAIRDGAEVRASRLGWTAEGFLAAGAAVAGLASTALTTPALSEATINGGVAEAQAAGFALAALAVVPALEGRDAFRLGTGLVLAVLSAALLQQGFVAGLPAVEQVAFAGLVVVVAAAATGLATAATTVSVPGARLHRIGAHRTAPTSEAGQPRWRVIPRVPPALPELRFADAARRAREESAVAGRRVKAGLYPRLIAGRALLGTAGTRTNAGLRTATSRAREMAHEAKAEVAWRLPGRGTDATDLIGEEMAGSPGPVEASADGEPEPPHPTISARSAGARRSFRRGDR
jgi:hypothetical protein